MKNSLRRDNLFSIVGTILTVGFFVLAVYLPNERACQAARREITIANRTIDSAPMLIQQTAMQQQWMTERTAALRQLDRLLEDENELHGVLQSVANLAQSAGLKLDRIQPQAVVTRETYRVVPYQVTISGNFRRIAQFLHGLESQPTLFAIERLQLKSEAEQESEALKADFTFSVFVKRASFVGFAEKSDSLTQTQADERRATEGTRLRGSGGNSVTRSSNPESRSPKPEARSQIMSRSTFYQRLMRDFKASAAKTVTLGLLLMVGLFFWVPPLLKAFSSNATAAPKTSVETTTPKPEANASSASTAGESPVAPKNRDSKTMAKQHREQPLLQPVEADGMPRNPFCLDDELLPLPVLIAEDVSTEPTAPSPKQVELPALKLDGLVLKSTLIGANRKVAMINNQLLREGQSISWNDRQLRLESIRRKSVTLTDGTHSWQLNLKDSGDDSND